LIIIANIKSGAAHNTALTAIRTEKLDTNGLNDANGPNNVNGLNDASIFYEIPHTSSNPTSASTLKGDLTSQKTQYYSISWFIGQFTTIKRQSAKQWESSLLYRVKIPFLDYNVNMRFGVKFMVDCTIPRMNYDLSFPHIIGSDSLYIQACQNGLLLEVKKLFIEGKAYANDITADNMTPLFVRPPESNLWNSRQANLINIVCSTER
jgi:hypothetical protein